MHETFKKYCDSSFTHNAIYSNGRNLWVRFVSGVSDDKYNGWTAVYFPARKNASEYYSNGNLGFLTPFIL